MVDNTEKNDSGQIDEMLSRWSSGESEIEERLIELLYPHIHKIAHFQIKSKAAAALQTTEIVSEAFIRLSDQKTVDWKNKKHFLAIAAKVIRRVIVDHYRTEISQRRGGQEQHLTLERMQDFIEDPANVQFDWLELNELLDKLNEIDTDAAQVVEYKVFGGLTIPEMAETMAVSKSTISRNWQFAKSWLLLKLQ